MQALLGWLLGSREQLGKHGVRLGVVKELGEERCVQLPSASYGGGSPRVAVGGPSLLT